MSEARYRIVLAKEDFKFSIAHFTVFGDGCAEILHGHNYRVVVELEGGELDEWGLLADVAAVKGRIRELCGRLDNRTVIPTASPLVTVARDGEELEIRFAERRYRLPRREVLTLPLANTSMELLARWFWEELVEGLRDHRLDHLAVTVEETPGQRCVYARGISTRRPFQGAAKPRRKSLRPATSTTARPRASRG